MFSGVFFKNNILFKLIKKTQQQKIIFYFKKAHAISAEF